MNRIFKTKRAFMKTSKHIAVSSWEKAYKSEIDDTLLKQIIKVKIQEASLWWDHRGAKDKSNKDNSRQIEKLEMAYASLLQKDQGLMHEVKVVNYFYDLMGLTENNPFSHLLKRGKG